MSERESAKTRSRYAVGEQIHAWWEWWDGDVLRTGSGLVLIVASSRSERIVSTEAAAAELGVDQVKCEVWRRVTKADVEDGVADEGTDYGAEASGAGWIRVALPSVGLSEEDR